MLGNNDLESQVDKYLDKQAKLQAKSRQIVDLFNEQYSKKEVESFVDYLLKNSAKTYDSDLQEFIQHYESNDKDAFTEKDIKIYLTLSKVHKKHMKEPKSEEENNSSKAKDQDDSAEGNYE